MSIPTSAPVPTLVDPNKVREWSRDLVAYLSKHLPIFQWTESRIVLVNGGNNNVDPQGGNSIHIVGPTAGFTITGFSKGSPGRQLIIQNDSTGTMSLTNNDASSAVGNRILTYGGTVTTTIATLLWDHIAAAWQLVSKNP